jgi:hypothetical protein
VDLGPDDGEITVVPTSAQRLGNADPGQRGAHHHDPPDGPFRGRAHPAAVLIARTGQARAAASTLVASASLTAVA